MHRAINGVVTIQVWDRTTNQTHRVGSFDTISHFVVTKIDVEGATVTFADSKADMKLFIVRAKTPTP